jgi:hypothetical protein
MVQRLVLSSPPPQSHFPSPHCPPPHYSYYIYYNMAEDLSKAIINLSLNEDENQG